jgi:transposase
MQMPISRTTKELEVLTNRIPKAVHMEEFREGAVKLAMTDGAGVSEAARRPSITMKTLTNRVLAAKDGMLENVG